MKKQNNQRWQTVLASSIIMLSIIVSGAGCRAASSSNPSPSQASLSPAQTVEQSIRLYEQDNLNEFKKLLSAKYKAEYAPNSIGEKAFPVTSKIMKGFGGIKSIEILKEDVSGDKADVTYIIHYGNGMAPKCKQSLLKEDVWKLDGNGENIQ